ncbi:MAG: hypothetical protein ACKO7P_02865 [Bacteroidota bacterium]
MSFNVYSIDFNGKELILPLEKSQSIKFISKEVINKVDLFYNIVSNIYYQQQLDRKGIKNLGDKIRHDNSIKEIFKGNDEHCIVKATANRMAFTKLFLETLENIESKKIYFFILSKNLNRLSQIFDQTSTTKEDIDAQLNTLKKFSGDVVLNKEIYILEITSFPNHQFLQTEENYSRIYEDNYGKNN